MLFHDDATSLLYIEAQRTYYLQVTFSVCPRECWKSDALEAFELISIWDVLCCHGHATFGLPVSTYSFSLSPLFVVLSLMFCIVLPLFVDHFFWTGGDSGCMVWNVFSYLHSFLQLMCCVLEPDFEMRIDDESRSGLSFGGWNTTFIAPLIPPEW